jgi:hypothetical protein
MLTFILFVGIQKYISNSPSLQSFREMRSLSNLIHSFEGLLRPIPPPFQPLSRFAFLVSLKKSKDLAPCSTSDTQLSFARALFDTLQLDQQVNSAARLLPLISLRIPSQHLLSCPLRQTILSQWAWNLHVNIFMQDSSLNTSLNGSPFSFQFFSTQDTSLSLSLSLMLSDGLARQQIQSNFRTINAFHCQER